MIEETLEVKNMSGEEDTKPLAKDPECYLCYKTSSFLFRTVNEGCICSDCWETQQNNKSKGSSKNLKQVQNTKSTSDNSDSKATTRKSARTTRNYKTRLNPLALPKTYTPKGKGRRVIFKKTPQKAPQPVAVPITTNHTFYKGSYIQVGDIVSLQDAEGDVYYAQIRGLLSDQYCEKSAVITWLIPTVESIDPSEGFDPATYIIGPDEDIPRKLDCMEFVMHAPSDYFKARNTPYPPINPPEARNSFIWTRLGFEQRRGIKPE